MTQKKQTAPEPEVQPKVESVVTPITEPSGQGIKPRPVGGPQLPTESSIVAHVEPGTVTKAKPPKPPRPRWRKTVRKIAGVVAYLAIVALLVVGTPKFLSWYLKSDTPMAAITSDSMWPALKRGDLVFIEGVRLEQLEVGDVVVYANQRGFTIHRVTQINPEQGTLTTKGDANNVSDTPVKASEVIGRAVAWGDQPIRIPKLGLISIFVSKKLQ